MKFNNETIRVAVKEYFEDSKEAEKKYGHISDWDVSNVTDMSKLFSFELYFNHDTLPYKRRTEFNKDISNWDVSNVTDMSDMFCGNDLFIQEIGKWDVSNVSNMSGMFSQTKSFNKDIGNWDVSKVTDMSDMFRLACSFNQDIGGWDVSNVTDMRGMFQGSSFTDTELNPFNKDISNWDVSKVTDMSNMFCLSRSFKQDIGSWDVSSVISMRSMFELAKSFNHDIGNWDVSNVTNMKRMFFLSGKFNQDISKWNVTKVITFEAMFCRSKSFNQNLKKWKVNKEADVFEIFFNTKSFKQDTNEWKWINCEENEERAGCINVDIEGYSYTHGDGESEFGAYELSISFGGSWADGDGEYEILNKIRKELNCDHIIITNVKNDNGEYEYYRIVDLPEIFEAEFVNSHITIESNFTEDEDVINFVKNFKTISYKKINPNNEKEIELGYTDLYTGVRKTHHENGKIETERTYVDGVENGSAKGWFESGELEFEAFKENGLVQGLVKNYYENGNLRIETNYIDQVKDGEEKLYYDNGQLGESRNYENGIVCGVEKIYNEDGDLQSETEHKATVSRVNWEEMEDVGVITHYKDKPFTGVAFDLHENGNVLEEIEMLEGLKHGKQVYYSDDSTVDKVSYYENDLRLGHDENTYDKTTNELFPDDKYDDMQKILFKIDLLMRVYKGQDEERDIKQFSEAYYEAFSAGIVDSMQRLNKFSEKAIDQAEDMYAKINSSPCDNTIKFTNDLKKYIKTHNDTAVIEVSPSKYGVWEEFIHKGQWKNKNFTMKIIIPLKNAEFEYDGSLSDFIEQIGTKNITQLDNSNLDLGLLGDSGGSYEVNEITWDGKLSKNEEKIFDENDILREWLDNGMISDDDKMVFEKGCIYEIEVTVGDKIFTLVK